MIKSWKAWGSIVKAPKLPENYLERFIQADMTFLHQRVYDPRLGRLVTLTPLPHDIQETQCLDHLGP